MDGSESPKITPLQQAKKDKIDELTSKDTDTGAGVEKKRGVQKGARRGVYKSKTKPRPEPKETTSEPEYTFEMAEKDASFLTTFVNSFRSQAGIGPIHEDHQRVFEHSACQLYMKYGPSAARWMPEVMFAGSLFVILIDTAAQVKKLKAVKKVEPRKDDRVIEPEKVNQESDKMAPDMGLSGTPDMTVM